MRCYYSRRFCQPFLLSRFPYSTWNLIWRFHSFRSFPFPSTQRSPSRLYLTCVSLHHHSFHFYFWPHPAWLHISGSSPTQSSNGPHCFVSIRCSINLFWSANGWVIFTKSVVLGPVGCRVKGLLHLDGNSWIGTDFFNR